MSNIPIPALMISHDLFHDQTITNIDQLAHTLSIAKEDQWNIIPANNKATVAFWDMVRVNVMIHRDPALTGLYSTWNDLGYTNTQPHVFIGDKQATRPFNIKVSMMLRAEHFGLFAFMPLEIWNIVTGKA